MMVHGLKCVSDDLTKEIQQLLTKKHNFFVGNNCWILGNKCWISLVKSSETHLRPHTIMLFGKPTVVAKTILNMHNVVLRRLESILKRFEVKISRKNV